MVRSTSALILLMVSMNCMFHVYGGFQYGKHFPRGAAAVDYAYKTLWYRFYPANYNWNYYQFCETSNHPYNIDALVKAADGNNHYTARDANCHLLLDFNKNYELATNDGQYSFIEHAGVGVNGVKRGNPFSIHWYDDNWFATYMAIAYDRPQPFGLVDYGDFTRWKVVGGDTTAWTPYSKNFIDTLALDSLYYLATGDVKSALSSLQQILSSSDYTYDSSMQRYVYPNINENYHYGLALISAWMLLGNGNLPADTQNLLLQHAISLRSNIMSFQERQSDGTYVGWVTGTRDPNTLINIESITACVLGLGANAYHTFEVGQAPLLYNNSNSYFYRPHNTLSAVVGLSKEGFMSYGPYIKYPAKQWTVKFYARSPSNDDVSAMTFEVVTKDTVLSTVSVNGKGLRNNNEWTEIPLSFTLSAETELEFRAYWHGLINVDISLIRVI